MRPIQISKVRKAMDSYSVSRDSYASKPGVLDEELVRFISKDKNEPEWMLQKRLKALELFRRTPMPKWGPDLGKLDLGKITFYRKPDATQARDWEKVPAQIKRTFEALGIPEAERKALAGAGAQYECLSEDSIVFTNSKGPIEIKDLNKGDYVFAFDEKDNKIKRAKVLGKLEMGENEVYEIAVNNKRVKATANHPFLTLSHYKKQGARRGRYKREWKPLKELKGGDLVAIAKTLPLEGMKPYKLKTPPIKQRIIIANEFGSTTSIDLSKSYMKVKLQETTTDDLMWFLGLYIGDGYIKREMGRDKKRVYFAIPDFQAGLRKELMAVVKKIFDYDIKSEEKFRVSINSTIIADFIEVNGFKGNSKQKRLPKWLMALPSEQRLAFLSGYTDSDGYVTHDKKAHILIFRAANKELVNDLRDLAIYCNLHPSIIHTVKSKHPLDKKRTMYSYQTEVSGNLSTLKSRYEPKATRLMTRKTFQTFATAKGTVFRKHTNEYLGFAKIKSIEPAGIQKVFDIEVEGYHNFLADGLIVHNSNVIYHNLKKEFEKKGVIFEDMDTAVQKYPELVKKHFMTSCIPISEHKFIMLHAAVWSGGTFIYVPEGVKVGMPLQAYFRMNAKRGGQFEHTLIIAEKGSEVSYIEGCSAPQFGEAKALHAGCVEIFVNEGARVRYSSVENWSTSTFNLNTKRAIVEKNSVMEWVGGNMGSCTTMLYPSSILKGEGARASHLGIAYAGAGQNQDTGAKVYHLAPNTSSHIRMKSISKDGGICTYRGTVKVAKGAKNSKVASVCDALILDRKSISNTIPKMDVMEESVEISHEATVGKLSTEKIFYLMSRGIKEEEAVQMIVSGFIEPVMKELPLEYAVELNKLIQLEMTGAVG